MTAIRTHCGTYVGVEGECGRTDAKGLLVRNAGLDNLHNPLPILVLNVELAWALKYIHVTKLLIRFY